ncbi:hypothetical protein CRUP_020640 [Coryphaenoides rupestris]|nr:hypothetical protein CRUP_020640 [Coryphaenoides rupestris]
MDDILENLEEVEITARGDDEDEDDEDEEVPPELLLGRDQLIELSQESAKSKPWASLIGYEAIVVYHAGDDGADEDRRAPDDRVDRRERLGGRLPGGAPRDDVAGDAQGVYIEDVIEWVLRFTRFHCRPPCTRTTTAAHAGSTSNQKAKRPKCPSQRQKVVTLLYNKLCDVFRNLSELLSIPAADGHHRPAG